MQDNMQTINVKVNPYIEMGKQEGRREGMLEGRREGMLEGRREGMLEGRREGIIKVAKAMLEEGLPIDLISRTTKLPEDVIKSLLQ